MLAELMQILSSNVSRGMVEATGAVILCLAVVLICRRFAVHVEHETVLSLARGLVQMVFVGMVLALLLGNVLVRASSSCWA